MVERSFFTNETYARGNQAYQLASTNFNSTTQKAALTIAQLVGVQPDGMVTIYSQADPPATPSDTDMWMDIDNGNLLQHWNGAYGATTRTNHCTTPSPEYTSVLKLTPTRGDIAIDHSVEINGRASWRSVISDASSLGTHSQNMTWGDNKAVTPGQVWSVTCMMRSTALSGITKFSVMMLWENASHSLIGVTNGSVSTAPSANSWVLVTVTGTAPVNAAFLKFSVGPADPAEVNVSDAYFVADLLIEQTSTPGVFFCGGMPGASWTGVAGESTSTYTPSWVTEPDQTIIDNIVAAAGVTAMDDGKLRVFYRSDAPSMTTGQDIGDLWVDIETPNVLYRWDGDSWDSYSDARVIMDNAQAVRASASGKNKVYYSTSTPGTTPNTTGDIWFQEINDQIIAQWVGQGGSSWQQVTLRSEVIAFLDAAKITARSITTDKLSAGVISTNLVPDPSFEEIYTMEPFNPYVAPGPGYPYRWRNESYANGNVTITNGIMGRARSGARSLSITVNENLSGGGAVSGVFRVKPGKRYKLLVYAASIGQQAHLNPGVMCGSSELGVDFFNYFTIEGLSDYGTVDPPHYPSATTLTADQYGAFAWEFQVPAGETRTYAAVRLVNFLPASGSTLVVDDVSVIEMGNGGAAELTGAGLRLFNEFGEEIGAFVSNRPSYFSITNTIEGVPTTVAQITGAGDATFHSVASSEDMVISGQPILGLYGNTDALDFYSTTRNLETDPIGLLEGYSKGSIAPFDIAPSSISKVCTDSDNYHLFTVSATLEPGREYHFVMSSFLVNISAMASTDSTATAGLYIKYTNNGTEPSLTNGTIINYYYSRPPTNGFVTLAMPYTRIYNESTTAVDFKIAVFMNAFNCSTQVYQQDTSNRLTGTIIDDGPRKANAFTIKNVLTADAPPPATKTTYVTTWNASNSESYGNFGARSEAELYHGYYSSNQGDQFAHILFGGNGVSGQAVTVATAMSGATLKKVELYVKNLHTYNSSGMTMKIRQSTATSLSGTANGGTAKSVAIAQGFGGWIDITSVCTTGIRSISLGKYGGTSLTGYGYFANHSWGTTSYRPKLRITYEK